MAWPCNIDNLHVAFFPEKSYTVRERQQRSTVWAASLTGSRVQDDDALGAPRFVSFGSLYGGHSMLAQKWFGLDWASLLGYREGWMAEHCAIITLVGPDGRKFHLAAIFPSSCGKTSLALHIPTIPGWTVRCVSENMAWLRVGGDGRLYATNPESGFFGEACGNSQFNNLGLMASMKKGRNIFTNVALTPEGDVWWEGKTKEAPTQLQDWKGKQWAPSCGSTAAHPNARYTFPATNCPLMDEDWNSVGGVPIDAFLLGGRRSAIVPLVAQAHNWEHGIFLGSVLSSETTASTTDSEGGQVKRDPFAIRTFLGYRLGEYLQHWMEMGKRLGRHAPLIFQVNWFRKENGNYLWPGYGDNTRVLKWICQRISGAVDAKRTAVGLVPYIQDLDLAGLDKHVKDAVPRLLQVNPHEWNEELLDMKKFLESIEETPNFITRQVNHLEKRYIDILNWQPKI